MQSVLRVLYPPQCISCGELVEDSANALRHLLAPDAVHRWRRLRLLRRAPDGGAVAHGGPLRPVHDLARPWSRGRAALAYRDNARVGAGAQARGPDRSRRARGAMDGPGGGAVSPRGDAGRARPGASLAAHEASLQPGCGAGAGAGPGRIPRLRARCACPFAGHARAGWDESGRAVPNLSTERSRRIPKRGARLRSADIVLVDDVMTSGATLARRPRRACGGCKGGLRPCSGARCEGPLNPYDPAARDMGHERRRDLHIAKLRLLPRGQAAAEPERRFLPRDHGVGDPCGGRR
jgi:hypothetical protein